MPNENDQTVKISPMVLTHPNGHNRKVVGWLIKPDMDPAVKDNVVSPVCLSGETFASFAPLLWGISPDDWLGIVNNEDFCPLMMALAEGGWSVSIEASQFFEDGNQFLGDL